MKELNRLELEENLLKTIPDGLELRNSSVSNRGIFALNDIPKGTKFNTNLVKKLETKHEIDEFHDYTWRDHTLLDGIGYFCNGSCDLFERYDEGTIIGPYITKKINIKRCMNDDGTFYFITTREIKKGEELILQYNDSYFQNRLLKMKILLVR